MEYPSDRSAITSAIFAIGPYARPAKCLQRCVFAVTAGAGFSWWIIQTYDEPASKSKLSSACIVQRSSSLGVPECTAANSKYLQTDICVRVQAL